MLPHGIKAAKENTFDQLLAAKLIYYVTPVLKKGCSTCAVVGYEWSWLALLVLFCMCTQIPKKVNKGGPHDSLTGIAQYV